MIRRTLNTSTQEYNAMTSKTYQLVKPKTATSNGWTIDVMDDYHVVRNLNPDTLDNITLSTRAMTTQLDIEMDDKVLFVNELTGLYEWWLVATFEESVIYDGETPYYTYKISLADFTKLLEKIPLPNLTHTNNYGDEGVSLLDAMERVCNYHIKDIDTHDLFGNNTGNVYVRYEYPTGMNTRVCPNYSISSSTLREYLDYCYGIMNGCRVKLKGYSTTATLDYSADGKFRFIVTYVNPNTRGSAMNTENTLFKRMSPSDNSSNLVTELSNVYSGYEYVEYQPLKTSTQYWDTSALLIQTNHNINYIDHVYAWFPFDYGSLGTDGKTMEADCSYLIKVDITDYILEESQYSTKPTTYVKTDGGKYDTFDDSKRWYMYFSEGSNKIENVVFDGKNIFNQSVSSYTFILIGQLFLKKFNAGDESDIIEKKIISGTKPSYTCEYFWHGKTDSEKISWTHDEENIYFEIHYNGDSNAKFSVCQTRPYNHRILGVSNQTDSLVNFDRMVASNLENVNATGEPTIQFYGQKTYENRSKTPQAGQTYKTDYVVSSIEYTIGNGVVNYMGVLTKYFSNINEYKQIERKRRFTALASASESTLRHELIRKVCKVTAQNISQYTSISKMNDINYAVVTLQAGKTGTDYSVSSSSDTIYTKTLIMPVARNFSGNFASYNVSFETNVKAGFIKSASVISGTSTYAMENVTYCDIDGEDISMVVDFLTDVQKTDDYSLRDVIAYMPKIRDESEFVGEDEDTAIQLSTSFNNIYKDNAECMSLSVQVDFVSGDDYVIIGNRFADLFDNDYVYYKYTTTTITMNQQMWDVSSFTKIDSESLRKGSRFAGASGNVVICNSSGDLICAVNSYNNISSFALCFGNITDDEAKVINY